MKILEKVLLAVDFGERSEHLVEKAIEFSKIFQSELIPIHVLPTYIQNDKARKLLDEAATSKLKLIADRIREAGLKTREPVVEHGVYFEKVIETAAKIDANLVVIGAGNKPEDTAFQLGYTAENIVRNCNKPVWVEKNGSAIEIKNIICPVDFSDESTRALKNAIVLARRIHAKLVVFSVYDRVYTGAITLDIDWEEHNESARLEHLKEFDSFLDNFNLTDLNWEKVIESGEPHTQILVAIKKYQSDLVIMGTTGKTGLSKMILGSVTEKVIREVPCSFVTLKTEDVIELKLEHRLRSIENYFKEAEQLRADGFLEEAILQYKMCLDVNDMHMPSLYGLAKVYDLLGDKIESKVYRTRAQNVYDRNWNLKIEEEVRRTYKM